MMRAVNGSTIGNHFYVRSTTLDQMSCQFGIVLTNNFICTGVLDHVV